MSAMNHQDERFLRLGLLLAGGGARVRRMAGAVPDNKALLEGLAEEGAPRALLDTAQKLGATAMQGRTFLELGDLYLTVDNPDDAKGAYQKSIALFGQSDAGMYLQQARERLEQLDKNHFR